MILAAGKGTRLGQVGADVPKCMLPLGGRPLLEWTVRRLHATGVSDVVINLHHAPNVIPDHFGNGDRFGVRIQYSYEPEPLGTAGAVMKARELIGDADPFLLLYGDTVLDWDPSPAIEDHRKNGPVCTLAVARVLDPRQFGLVLFDASRRVTGFVEKPEVWTEPEAWVNAGVYILNARVYEFISPGFCDFGKDVFPSMLASGAHLRAYSRPGELLAVDTPEQYELACLSWC